MTSGEPEETTVEYFTCHRCGYYYDPDYGDEEQGISPGTPFIAIPLSWRCPRCHSDKRKFYEIELHDRPEAAEGDTSWVRDLLSQEDED